MKNMIFALAFLISFIPGFATENDWGQNGHRATGEIATNHLTAKAKKEIERILKGKSLARVSTYADEIKSDSKYREFGPWHYVNMPPGEKAYTVATANPEGDLLKALKICTAVLKDKKASDEDKEFYLKMLVHFVGDLHQPLHAGRGEDKGGNDIQVRWYNEGTNLHSVWDTKMIESYDMSYTELAANAKEFNKKEIQMIAAGNFEDWMYESKELSKQVYNSIEIGEKLGYKYMYDWFPVVIEQLQKGGIRLAKVLNEIYK
jgi:hypothetical protein